MKVKRIEVDIDWNKAGGRDWYYEIGIEICPATRFIKIAIIIFTVYIYWAEKRNAVR